MILLLRCQFNQHFMSNVLYENVMQSFSLHVVNVCNFSLKEYFRKNARKMLVKLTTGVNFINVKHTNFSYELRFSSYVLALSKNLYEKFARKMLVKLTTGFPSSFICPTMILIRLSWQESNEGKISMLDRL